MKIKIEIEECKKMGDQKQQFTLNVVAPSNPIVITPSQPNGALPDAQVGVVLDEQIATVTGGTPPYSYNVDSGALPAGVQLLGDPNAGLVKLSGTPTVASQPGSPYAFDLDVTDSAPTPAKASASFGK